MSNDRDFLLQEQRERKEIREHGMTQQQSFEDAIKTRARLTVLYFCELMNAGLTREEALFLAGHTNL